MTSKKDGNIFKILGIELISNSLEEVLRLVERRIAKSQKTFIVTPNPEFLVFAQQNPWFGEILTHSDIAIPDGIALLWASEVIKGKAFLNRLFIGFWTGLKVIFFGWGKKRVTGADLTEKLCQLAAKNSWTVYFLGGKERERAPKALRNMQKKYSGLKGWANPGPPMMTLNPQKPVLEPTLEVKRIVEDIKGKQPDLLFVALNMGKQEKFIFDNWNNLDVKLAMGVGGAFDYLSGQVKRAPFWIQKSGFEWLYRLVRQPWRIRRQLSLGKFIFLVLKEKLSTFALHAQKP